MIQKSDKSLIPAANSGRPAETAGSPPEHSRSGVTGLTRNCHATVIIEVYCAHRAPIERVPKDHLPNRSRPHETFHPLCGRCDCNGCGINP
ncbi:hypothetical protein MPLA_180099 [Mesorhizobium sp. ORS 3359]|nr:hypothetical protein MPLA_180099 [Mesorhizobium sp. ORS 3359]